MLRGLLECDDDPKEKFWRGIDFWREVGVGANAPIIEPLHDENLCLATFLFRGYETTKRVALLGCPTDQELEPMMRLGDTDIWYRSLRIPSDARFTYCIQMNGPEVLPTDPGEWRRVMKDSPPLPDPLNPRSFAGYSMVECPDAPLQPWLEEKPGVARGEVRRTEIHSSRLDEVRTLTTYTPAGFSGKSADPIPLLMVLDGQAFGGHDRSPVSLPTIMDNLIAAGEIPPTLAILINEEDMYEHRNRDFNGSESFAAFLAEEVIPWAEKRWGVKFDGQRTILFGTSSGGLCAAYAALKHPDRFGNVISLSGYFSYEPDGESDMPDQKQPSEGWLLRQYRAVEHRPVRFYLEVGRFERQRMGGDFVAANRQFRDGLRSRDYDVLYRERPGGHDLLWWQGAVADGLIALSAESDQENEDEEK
jgi:enterochelin esterase family protein